MSETLANVFGRRKADPTQATPNATLYEKLGGAPAVDAAVEMFYKRVVADARINYFFFGVNVAEQIEKQKAFMAMAFGGPHHYTGRDMRRSHAKLVGMGMNDRHFDIVVEHLRDTLVTLQVPEDLIAEVVGICESTREDVMNRRSHAPESTRPSRPTPPPPPAPAPVAAPPVAARPAERSAPAPSGTIQGLVSSRIVPLSPDSSIREAADRLAREGLNALPVVDAEGRLVGLLTAGDLIRHLSPR